MHRPLRNARVVVLNSLLEVRRHPDIETMIGVLNNVDPNHEVHGYRADGTRIRIRRKSEGEARMKKSEEESKLINAQRSTRFVQTRLSDAQLDESETCVARLVPRYTLTEAVDFFLRHYRAPEFTISVSEAPAAFRAALEGQVRDRTLVQLKSTLGQFERFTDNCKVHEVTTATVESFLSSLGAKNGADKASLKTWNNYRADLHLFFEWCAKKQQRYVASNPAVDAKPYKIDSCHVHVLNIQKCRDLMTYAAELKAAS